MRLADESDLAGIELRFPDGRAWSGEGGFGYVREARILGRSGRVRMTAFSGGPGDVATSPAAPSPAPA